MSQKKYNNQGLPGKRFRYRQLLPIIKYSTPTKFQNLLFCELGKRCNIIKPRSNPYIGILDITNICNMRCYHCPTGKHLYGRDPGSMDLSYVEKFMKKMGKYLYLAHLYSWGEPLLHPKVTDIIRLVKSYRVSTIISSNLNTKNRALLEGICDSGLDYLALSIDGSSQEVYSRYRIGGDLDLVLQNIQHINNYKKKNNLRTPVIEWQFLVFDHNKHEVKSAYELSRDLHVDIFNAKPGIIPDKFKNAWTDRGLKCPFLWNTVVLNNDGGLSACCNLIDKEDDFDNLSTPHFKEIWHNPRYTMARKLFSPARVKDLPPNLNHPCLNCSLVRQQPHLSEYLKTNKHTCVEDTSSIHKDDTIAVRTGKVDS